jgi:two-component system nitrate/nitrite response regulator NarL
MAYPVNVRLLCGNAIVREGLSRILMDRDFRVCQYPNIATALQKVEVPEEDTGPSLLLIDNGTEELDADSVEVLQRRFPCSYLVVLSDRFDFQTMLKAFRLGAMVISLRKSAAIAWLRRCSWSRWANGYSRRNSPTNCSHGRR